MQQTRFMVLTGHLNDYPLPDLVGILRHQRKTGRLLVEYPIGPCSFFFKDGELVDVQLGELGGIQAVCIAISQPNASFNFNPLIQPPAQSIDNSLQKVVTQLLDCWEEETPAARVKSVGGNQTREAFFPAPSNDLVESDTALAAGGDDDILALPPPSAPANLSRPAVKRNKQALYASAVGLLLLIVPAVIALTNSLGRRETPAASSAIEVKDNSTNTAPNLSASSESENPPDASSDAAAVINNEARAERRPPREQPRVETNAPRRNEFSSAPPPAPPPAPTTPTENDATSRRQSAAASAAPPPASAPAATSGEQTMTIVMQVENGRVTQAHVANRRPGMEAFEASALRVARQRRFPPGTATTETMRIKVTQPK